MAGVATLVMVGNTIVASGDDEGKSGGTVVGHRLSVLGFVIHSVRVVRIRLQPVRACP
jgi:hypothetical protein